MATLNEVVQGLADSAKQSDNHNLKERLKVMFRNWVAKFIRQDIERNGGQQEYAVTYRVTLISTDIADTCGSMVTGCTVLKSDSRLVMPIPLKGRPSWNYVGSIDRKIPFTYCSLEDVDDLNNLKYIKGSIFYDVVNGRLYVANNIKLGEALMEAYYTDMHLIQCMTDTSCYTDDTELPIPAHIIADVMGVMRKELLVIEEVKEVNISTDDNKQ